ncbi:MAG: SatD family protein [Cyclobacteriaceae bacterium]
MKSFILMGDVVDSSKMDSQQLMADLKSIVNKINSEESTFFPAIKSPLTITLGDEFQGIVNSLKIGLLIIFKIDHELTGLNKSFQMRYVISQGEIATAINKDKAYEMLGSGLTEARETLNSLKKSKTRILVSGLDGNKNELINDALILYQSIIDNWKKKDKQVAYDLVKTFNFSTNQVDYKLVAKYHDKDPSTMWRKKETLQIEQYFVARRLIMSLAS